MGRNEATKLIYKERKEQKKAVKLKRYREIYDLWMAYQADYFAKNGRFYGVRAAFVAMLANERPEIAVGEATLNNIRRMFEKDKTGD